MKLLETFPQDIKSERSYKPCAPGWFRWVVIGAYVSVLLIGAVAGVVSYNEGRVHAASKKSQGESEAIRQKIDALRAQSSQGNQVMANYNIVQDWLRGNYSIAAVMEDVFAALPTEARLQEMSLKKEQMEERVFQLRMRFFGRPSGLSVDVEPLEERLRELEMELANRQQSVAEGGRSELGGVVILPQRYFPQPPMAGGAQ
jgi:uncharacterized membrane protein